MIKGELLAQVSDVARFRRFRRLRRCVKRYLPILLLFISGLLPVALLQRELQTTARAATTFVVTNVNDSGPGSVRQAIIDANANPGLDTIVFNIGSGHKTIRPMSRLPSLTDPVVIDGSTQPGFSGFPIIEIDSSILVEGNGLVIAGGDSTVRSLVINGSHFDGIAIGFKGGNRVEGCYIGTDVTGTFPRPNGGNGVSAPSSNNIIGGTTPATRNVISGNNGAGIDISRFCCTGDESPITGNVIRGNYIGVNAAGAAAIPNQREGVRFSSVNANVPVTGNFVGGTQPGAGNVVSGNHLDGVELDGFQLISNNTVQGNLIGTDSTGNFAIPNDGSGLVVTGSNNLMGGSSAGARNVISGNGRAGSGVSGGAGVELGTRSGNIVQGNVIGMNASVTAPIPNLQHGLTLGGTNSVIGGVNPGEGNVIAFNGQDGIVDGTTSSAGNTFRGNSIFSNGNQNPPSTVSIGIDIGGLGTTPNDAGDADTGANNLQNFPVITSVTLGTNSVNVKGTLNSTASTSFIIDFYANSVCDPLGFGEGARFIGSATVMSNSNGDASFDVNFPIALTSAEVLTATATDPTGNTSEFSQCSVASAPSSGVINFSQTPVFLTEANGVASFTLIRTGGSAGSLTVSFSVVNQTATAGLDFTPTQGTLTFADGETSKMFTVPILEDNLDEPTETATVRLSTSGNLDTIGPQSTAMLTIFDNDPLPGVSVKDISVYEGNSGQTIMYFEVNLSAVSGKTVDVGFSTGGGTAINDYSNTGGGVTFYPGESSRTAFVRIFGDTQTEVDENFLINLTSASGATIARGQGIATILNDDGNTIPLQLMFEEIGSNPIPAAALDSLLFLRDPFQVVNSSNVLNQGADRNTRIIVFVTNLQLAAGENSSAVTVNLFDGNDQNYDVTAEDVRPVPGFSFTQVIFRLPDNLSPGKCMIKVRAHGQSSNSGTLTIKP